jgi:hypothetical protein
MGIRVQSQADIRVTQQFGHDLRMNILDKEKRRSRMPEVVEAHLRKSVLRPPNDGAG